MPLSIRFLLQCVTQGSVFSGELFIFVCTATTNSAALILNADSRLGDAAWNSVVAINCDPFQLITSRILCIRDFLLFVNVRLRFSQSESGVPVFNGFDHWSGS